MGGPKLSRFLEGMWDFESTLPNHKLQETPDRCDKRARTHALRATLHTLHLIVLLVPLRSCLCRNLGQRKRLQIFERFKLINIKFISSPLLANKPLACIPPVLLNSDWFFCKIFGDRIIISFVILGSEGLVLFFFIISSASKDDLPQTPQDELVRKSLLILEILTF